FCSTILDANTEFLGFALSPEGSLAQFAGTATAEQVERCLASMLIYSCVQFAREEMHRDDSELIALLARVSGMSLKEVMLRRDQLRKAPRSEEWMLYGWLCEALGASRPSYDAQAERSFAYQYLSYLGQYRATLEGALSGLES